MYLAALLGCEAWLRIAAIVFLSRKIGAAAQTTCSQDEYAISSQSDADALSSCSNITGLITVQSSTLTTLTLDGIKRLDGSLKISSCPVLTTISVPQLTWINYNLTLDSLPLLANLSLPLLDTIQTSLSWTSLPALVAPTLKTEGTDAFGNSGANIYGDLTIEGCSALTKMDFFNYGTFSTAGNITIANNPQMSSINLTTLDYSTVVQISNNGPNLSVTAPKMTSVGTLSLQQVTSLDFPGLATMDAVLTLEDNYFDAFDQDLLTSIGGDVFVENNSLMENLSLPALTQIGGGIYNGDFVISNNSALTAVNGLPELMYVDGNTNLSGNLHSVVIPELTDLSGGFHISTTIQDFNCSYWDYLFYHSDVSKYPSRYSCATTGSTDTAIHYTESTSSGIPKATKVIIIIVCIVVVPLILGVIARELVRRRRKRRAPREEPINLRELDIVEEPGEGVDGLPPYRRVGKPGEVPPRYKANESREHNQLPIAQHESQNQGQNEIQSAPAASSIQVRMEGWRRDIMRLRRGNG